jgi:hypothetical protein
LLFAVLEFSLAIAIYWPRKRPLVKALGEHPNAGLVIDQDFQAVTISIAEEEEVTRHRISLQLAANDPR